MKTILLAIVTLFQSVSYADLAVSQETMEQIIADLADDGRATVIVGLSDPDTADELSDATIKCIKLRFLRSPAISDSLTGSSMQVVDELKNLPFIVINVDSNGLDKLKTHSEVTSIEADTQLKLR